MSDVIERIVREYPQPIAWAVVKLENSTEPGARFDLALTGFVETTRYLALVAMAQYLDLKARGRIAADERFEGRAGGLLANAFGQWLDLLRSTDAVLRKAGVEWLPPGFQRRQACAPWTDLWHSYGKGNKEKLSAADVLSLVVEIRNRKAHPSTHIDTTALSRRLHRALIAWLEQLECLATRPPVLVESVEQVARDRVRIRLVSLVGAGGIQLPKVMDLKGASPVWKGVFLWDTQSEAIDLAPLGRVPEGTQELATLVEMRRGEPVYRTANPNVGSRTGERPLDEFRQRAPFLLNGRAEPAEPSSEHALDLYKRRFRQYLLDDGELTVKEEGALSDLALLAGLSDDGVSTIRQCVESEPEVQRQLAEMQAECAPPPVADPDPEPEHELPDTWPEAAHALLRKVRAAVLPRLPFEPRLVTADEDLDDVGNNEGELYFKAGRVQGVSIWFTAKRHPNVFVVVGFYSENGRRDPAYRAARAAMLESCDLEPVDGWELICPEWKTLALEAYGRKPIADLARPETVAEVTEIALIVAGYVAEHLEGVEPRPGGG